MATSTAAPTYVEQIDLYEQTEHEADLNIHFADCFFQKFKSIYPDIYISCPKQATANFCTKRPSLRGECCLKSSSAIQSYHRQIWRPRI